MPYAPGIEYRGGDYLYGAITGAARSIAGGLEDWKKKHDETQQKLQESGLLMDYATKKGYVTPEQITKYAAANVNQKADMASTLAKTIALEAHDQEQKAEQQFRADQLATQWAIANLPAKVPPVPEATKPGTVVTNPQNPSDIWGVFGANGQFIPAPRPVAGEDKTMFHQPGETYYDPRTGLPAGTYQGARGENVHLFEEMSPEKKAAAEAITAYQEQEKAKAAAQGAGGGFSLWHPSTWLGGGATPAPSARPAVTPAPVIAAATPTYPPVAPQGATVSPAPQLSAQDQQALAWAQANPNDPRAAAIRQKLGY